MNVLLGSVKPNWDQLCVQVDRPNPSPRPLTWLVYGENRPLPPHWWPWLANLNRVRCHYSSIVWIAVAQISGSSIGCHVTHITINFNISLLHLPIRKSKLTLILGLSLCLLSVRTLGCLELFSNSHLSILLATRVGILRQNAKSWYSGILGFEVRRNSKNFCFPNIALCQRCLCYLYCLGSLDVSSPDWHSLALGSILNNSTIIKSKLFNFIINQFTIPSLKKPDVVRPKNRFGKPNPGISAPMKCFWISTQATGPASCLTITGTIWSEWTQAW